MKSLPCGLVFGVVSAYDEVNYWLGKLGFSLSSFVPDFIMKLFYKVIEFRDNCNADNTGENLEYVYKRKHY